MKNQEKHKIINNINTLLYQMETKISPKWTKIWLSKLLRKAEMGQTLSKLTNENQDTAVPRAVRHCQMDYKKNIVKDWEAKGTHSRTQLL